MLNPKWTHSTLAWDSWCLLWTMCTSIYIDIKIGELYTSQCSAGTVCLTCDSEKDSSAHTQSVLFIFRGNNTICSWITKLYWLVILSMVLSWAAYYSAGRMSTCTDTVTDPLLPRHKHFKPVKLPWLRSRSVWRQDTINLTRFHSPFQCWFAGN